MKTARLGQTNLRVSRVAFGGIPIQRLAENEAVRVVQRCLDLGVTLLDTANGYTTSEERIGKAIAGRRDQVILATKSGARDKSGSQEHLELSLKRLNTDYIDLWQFHGISSPEDYEQVLGPNGAMETAQKALQDGKIRHIGVTSHSLDMAVKMAAAGHFETMQFPFNFVTNEAIQELLPLCRQHDVGFIAMKPFAGGMLNKATLSMKWLLQFDLALPDPGIEKAEEIEEIVKIVEGSWELLPDELAEIERIRVEVGTRFCRRCQYCLPCPQNINIPMMMTLPSFGKRFSPEQFRSDHFRQMIETAKTCTKCAHCEEHCPYKLPIRDMLVENIAYYEEQVAQ